MSKNDISAILFESSIGDQDDQIRIIYDSAVVYHSFKAGKLKLSNNRSKARFENEIMSYNYDEIGTGKPKINYFFDLMKTLYAGL